MNLNEFKRSEHHDCAILPAGEGGLFVEFGDGISRAVSARAAALELTLSPAAFRFEEGGVFCIAGADLRPALDGVPVPLWTALHAQDGSVLTFGGACAKGVRAYLCVSGGFDVPVLMGSRSTALKAGLGGFHGRALKDGDVLTACEGWIGAPRMIGFCCPAHLRPRFDDGPLRAVPGPQDDLIAPASVETFFSAEWTLTPLSDRMGARLNGPKLEHTAGADIVSDAIPLGAVQVPGSGQPIVMLADRQTTGGYVKIAVVHALDAARLSQMLPGARVRFERITQEQGIALSQAEAAQQRELYALAQHYAARGKFV